MLYKTHLRNLAVQALIAAQTYARNQVYAPEDYPTNTASYPCILVQCYRERKDARSHSQLPQFVAIGRLSVVARIQANDKGQVLSLLDGFSEQIEAALLTNQPLLQAINRFQYVETDALVSAEGREHIGEITFEFGLEYPVDIDPQDWQPAVLPPLAVPLEEVATYGDLQNVADPTGNYPEAPFPNAVTPAPRTVGPDGRTEIGALIELTQ